MPGGIDLGTLFANVELRVDKIATARSSVNTELQAIGSALGKIADQAEASGKRVEASIFSKKEQDALKAEAAALKQQEAALQRHQAAIGEMAATGAKAFSGFLSGVTLAAAAVVKMDADFNQSMQRVQANTTMTDADIVKMKESVISLGKESGASFDDLAQGYMHVANFGYSAADSQKILRIAMQAAVATGAKSSDTANLLAASLHMFGISADDAGKAMNVLHLAAAEGNMTLEQFVQASGPAFAFASNLGLSITDVSAAFSALTRNGFNAAEASTQVKAMFSHITEPSKKAREEIALLAKTTGVDLTNDFTASGLRARTLAGVLEDIAKATHGDVDAIEKLIPAMRGGIGVMDLAGKGGKDLKDILGDLNDGWSGKLDPTTQGYQKALQNLNTEIERVTNEVKADFIPAGEKLTGIFEAAIPVIRDTAHYAGVAADAFTALPRALQELILGLGATTLGFAALNRGLETVGIKLPGIAETFSNLTTNVGIAGEKIDGLTTKLSALESIGPIVITAVVAWEIGSKIGDWVAKQMPDGVAENEAAVDTRSASTLRSQRNYLAKGLKDPNSIGPQESEKFNNLLEQMQQRYGLGNTGWFGTYQDSDGDAVLSEMDREANIEEARETDRNGRGIPGFHAKPAPKIKPAKTNSGSPTGGKPNADSDAADKAKDDAQEAAAITRDQAIDALKKRIEVATEHYTKTGDKGIRYQLTGPGQMLDQLQALQKTDADANYANDKGDKPKVAGANRAKAYSDAISERNDYEQKIRDADTETAAKLRKNADDTFEAVDKFNTERAKSAEESAKQITEAEKRAADATQRANEEIAKANGDPWLAERDAVAKSAEDFAAAGVEKVKIAQFVAAQLADIAKRQQAAEQAAEDADAKALAETAHLYIETAERQIDEALKNHTMDSGQASGAYFNLLQAVNPDSPDYTRISDKMQGSANQNKTKREMKQAADDAAHEVSQDPFKFLSESMAKNLGDSIKQYKNFSQMFKAETKSIEESFVSAVAQMAAKWATLQLLGAAGATGVFGGPLGGIIGSGVATLFGGLFGGHRAGGGNMEAGKIYNVAEPGTGGEMVGPQGPSFAVPMTKLMYGIGRLTGGSGSGGGISGGVHIEIHHHGDIHGTEEFRSEMDHRDQANAWHITQRLPVSKP